MEYFKTPEDHAADKAVSDADHYTAVDRPILDFVFTEDSHEHGEWGSWTYHDEHYQYRACGVAGCQNKQWRSV